MIKDLLSQILSGNSLSLEQAELLMDEIMSGKVTPAQIGGTLVALKQKGETTDEIAGFVQSMRKHSLKITLKDSLAVDGCGTGGDGSDSFNVSSAAAIITAGAGVTVAKHGNRSVSSKCGSSDILEKTGGNINPGLEKSQQLLDATGFAFLFAPAFHPAMKHAIGPRRELGVRTVFNILGPMTNPAGVKRQIIGVYDKSLMRVMNEVLHKTGSVHVITQHSHDKMDEFSITSPTDYVELKDNQIREGTIAPEDVGLKTYPKGAIVGGDVEHNYKILLDILNGNQSAYRDASLFNAGAMLYVADKVDSIKAGVELAGETIDSGKAKNKLSDWIESSNS